ncbi:50S ribosomal protein L37ae [Candidatus Woesearchaeota archaeon]|nr:50S ribosomal protein L37ae [Candidatus Woesearchaeota archaeon]
MAVVKKFGSVKRFGARYGRRPKEKLAKIESIQKGKHKCPYCHALKVKRLSAGIWNCRKCGAKFTGKAYSLKKIVLKEEKVEKAKAEEKEAKKEE